MVLEKSIQTSPQERDAALTYCILNKVFIDPRLTSALVDRLIHHAHILTFTGESFRLKNALSKTEY